MIIETSKDQITDLDQGIKILTFSVTWCGRCKIFSHILELFAKAYPEITIYKVDADLERDWANEHGVDWNPYSFVYEDGEIVARIRGFVPQKTLDDIIANLYKYPKKK